MDSPEKTALTVYKAPNISDPKRVGLIILIVFVGGFLFWATFFTLESAAVASGRVILEGNRKSIQHLEGGIVKKIFVAEGSSVQAGSKLIELDQTQILSGLALLQGQINMLLAKEAYLIALRDNAEKVTYPQRLLDQQNNPAIREIIEQANELFKGRNQALLDGLNILENRKIQLKSEIDSLKAEVKANSDQIELVNDELKSWLELEKTNNYIDKPRVLALKREISRLDGEKNERLALVARAEQKINETDLQIINLKNSHVNDALKNLEETRFKLIEDQQKEKAAEDQLNRTIITSPIAGKVLNLKVHTIGGVIAPRETLMEIVPQQDRLIIEARINPQDIDVVHAGLQAKVRLTAYKQRKTPTLEGKLETVSADLVVDEKTNTSYYIARIVINAKELAQLKDVTLYPGMPAQVFIITGQRTPLNYFLTPIYDSFTAAFRED